MAKQLQYRGEFVSINGVVWRCEILRDAANPFSAVGDLDFPASEALVIEWPDTALEEPINGSAATLTLLSPSDRKYIDLYTVKPGAVRLDVYRNNVLYWSGTLDTEFYEEPYDRGQDYEVTLTFSDLGVLGRMPYDMSGVKTFRQIVDAGLAASKVNYASVDESLVSSKFPDDTAIGLSSLTIASENFYDEDGVAMSYLDAIRGILQPMALKIVQRAGKFYVYDLNGLAHSNAAATPVEWCSTGSQMGMSPVYNNIKITFSPYGKADVMSGDIDYTDVFGIAWTNLGSGIKYNGGSVPEGVTPPLQCCSYYPDYSDEHRAGGGWDYRLISFTIFLSTDAQKCKGLAAVGNSNYFFHVQPVLGGTEESGVVGGFYTGGHGPLSSAWPQRIGISPENHTQGSLAMRTKRVFLPKLTGQALEENYVHLSLDLLFDPRYNPYEGEGDDNEPDNSDYVKDNAHISLVPVSVVLYDEAGTALWHWSNKSLVENGHPGDSAKATAGSWVSGDAAFGDAWLAYYNQDNVDDKEGQIGWQTNRQSFGVPFKQNGKVSYRAESDDVYEWWMFDSFRKIPSGQFLPYPPEGGYLEVRVYNGVWTFELGDGFSLDLATSAFKNGNGYKKIRWQLYKTPQVSLAKMSLTLDDLTVDDIEYNGVLAPDAKDSLEIDTIVGSSAVANPAARGIMARASTGEMIGALSRNGVTDHPEQLLIGTLYSQYAERKIVLSGEVEQLVGGIALFSDARQPDGTKFIIRADSQDVITDTSEATLVELSEDKYEGQ